MAEARAIHSRVRFPISFLDDLVSKSGRECNDARFFGLGLEIFGAGFVGGGCRADEDE